MVAFFELLSEIQESDPAYLTFPVEGLSGAGDKTIVPVVRVARSP